MANVIDSLLIGIGFQADKKSAQNVEGSLDSIKSKALQLGSVLAGAFGANALTFGFAATNDELGKFADRWDIAANDVASYDRALQHAGGAQGEFLSTVSSLSKALAIAPFERAQMLGELSQFGIAGQVDSVLNASDALDAFLRSADQLQTLSGTRREKFISALGFSDSEVLLLDKGRQGIIDAVAAEKKMAPVTDQMTESAARFNDEWQDLKTNVTGFSNEVALPLTSAIADILVGMNDWIEVNREVVNSFIELGTGAVADNIELVAGALILLTGSSVISGVGKIASGLGLISKSAGSANKSVGALGKGMTALAGIAIVQEAAKGGSLSATSIFGDNFLTKLLDAPLRDLFDGGEDIDGGVTTQGEIATYRPGITSPPPVLSYGPQTSQVTKVEVYLDGAPVKAIVKQSMEEEAEQVIQDFETSNGG